MFSSKVSNFERLLDKATSKLLLEPEWDSIMQICDILRQGDVQPSHALTSIRKKIDNDNYHICNYGLLVLESVVKNCGTMVHNAIATKEFMNYMHQLAKKKQDSLKNKVLELIQVWSHAFRSNQSYRVIQETFNTMKAEGFAFPTLKESDAMFAAEKAPDWMDGEHCYSCVAPFTTFNRKHHCRACGQVFCQKCSSKVSIIPKFGIEKEVRVCDSCFDSINKIQDGGKKKGGEDDLPEEYLNSPLSKQSQVPPTKTEAEIQEEEELQLAIALSQSEAEAKKSKSKVPSPVAAAINKTESLYSQPQKQQPQTQPTTMDTSDMDPELARYLNRNYWQQKSAEMKSSKTPTTQPSAPTTNTLKREDVVTELKQQPEEDDPDRNQFLNALSSSIEIFVNRMKSNSQRNRSIANDSSVQTLFMTLTAMHPTLINYVQQLEASRAHYEGLQDKLGQLKDARDALDVLREEHREKEKLRQQEAEKARQAQLAQKLEVLRQQKQVYLEYQRQMALQRMQEQELEMRKRLEVQKQQQQLKSQQYAHPQSYLPPVYPPTHQGYSYPQAYPMPYMPNVPPMGSPQNAYQAPAQHSQKIPQQLHQPLPQHMSNGYDAYSHQQMPQQTLPHQHQPIQQPQLTQQRLPQQPLPQQHPPSQQLSQQHPPPQQHPQQNLSQHGPQTTTFPQQQMPAYNPTYQQAFQANPPQTTTQDVTPYGAAQDNANNVAELINFD